MKMGYSTKLSQLIQRLRNPDSHPSRDPDGHPSTTHAECVRDIPFLKELLRVGVISMDYQFNQQYPYHSPQERKSTEHGWQNNVPSNAVKFAIIRPVPFSTGTFKEDWKTFYHGTTQQHLLTPILLNAEGLKPSRIGGYGPGIYTAKSYWIPTYYYGTKYHVRGSDGKQYIYSMVLQVRADPRTTIMPPQYNTIGLREGSGFRFGGFFANVDANVPDNDMEYIFGNSEDVQIVGLIIKKFDASFPPIAYYQQHKCHHANGV